MSFFGEIYADPDLPHRARTVYMYLRDRAGGGSCWPGVKTIARDLHLSPRTVQRALNDLERGGYIQRQRRHRENGSCTSNLIDENSSHENAASKLVLAAVRFFILAVLIRFKQHSALLYETAVLLFFAVINARMRDDIISSCRQRFSSFLLAALVRSRQRGTSLL